MCLYVEISKYLRKPMIVYKILDHETLKSPTRSMEYKLEEQHYVDYANIANQAKVAYSLRDFKVEIHYGLHCFTSLREAMDHLSTVTSYRVFKAVIPKGAVVIKGDEKQLVTTDLIILPYYYTPIKIFGVTLFYKKIKYKQKEK